tara:strand:- start:31 stop:1218 length:1188 start_codon:yes stop_codon:yes gene_type:complete
MKVYLVGGAVRDKLLGLPVKEKDWVVVGSTAQEMKDKGYKQVGKDFPVFINPKTGEEYALARTERKSGHGYAGFEFNTNPNVTLEEDLARRDLTINAIAQDEDGTLIDPFNGQEDIKNKKLRHVSDAFSEDPLRVLRVARFKANLKNFEIAKETLQEIEKVVTSNEMKYLTGERIWLELTKSHDPLRFFFALKDISPETLLDIFPYATIKSSKQPSIDPYTNDSIHEEIQYMTKEEEDLVFDKRMVDHPDYLDWPKYVQISYLFWLFVPPDSKAMDVALKNINAPNECKELSKLLYFNLLVFELNEIEPDGLLRFIKKLDIRKEERLKTYLMIKKGEHDIYNKLLIEDLICDIKSFKLDNKDQNKSGEEIQKIVENAHLEIVNKHLDTCKKIFKK